MCFINTLSFSVTSWQLPYSSLFVPGLYFTCRITKLDTAEWHKQTQSPGLLPDQGSGKLFFVFLLLNPSSLGTAHLRRNVQWCHDMTGALFVIFSGANYVKRVLLKSRANRSLHLLSSFVIIMPKPGLHKAVRLQLTSDARYDRVSDSYTINDAEPDYFWNIQLWLTLVVDHQAESSDADYVDSQSKISTNKY